MSRRSEKNQTDLSRTWHSTSIAVKITAVVVWGVMPIAFAITIPLLSSIEDEISKDYWWKLGQIHRAIDQQFKENPGISSDSLRDELVALKKNYPYSYLHLEYLKNKIAIGERSSDQSIYAHQIKHNIIEQSTGLKQPLNFLLTLHFPSIERGIELERMKYGSLIVIFTIILGLYLVYVIRNTLHAPFQQVIEATQRVTEGKLDTRLDINSEDEFGHLSRFFNHMIEELGAQQQCLTDANKYLESVIKNKDMALAESRAKSLFLANMSHEIRTPMTAILGYADTLHRFDMTDKAEQKEALQTIYHNSKHLLNIINDILDLSKIEAEKLQIEFIAFSPINMLNEVNQLMSHQAKEKGISLEFIYNYPLPDVIYNDPTRFKQVLFNLIANALRFTEKGSVEVTLSCSFEQQKLNISVADNGIGLSEEQIAHLFQPYVQAKSSTARQFGGTGLGLMIAKQLVNLMHGDIHVQSVIGQGAVFEFNISTGDIADTERVTNVKEFTTSVLDDFKQIPELTGKVLLVEDVEDNQKLITLYVHRSGLDIDIANNGKEGLDMALAHHYNLILMDMQMPVMDGLTATRELRKLNYSGSIIALTANALKNERDIYLQAGCDAILTKPIDVDEFYNNIRKWLKPSFSKKDVQSIKTQPVSRKQVSNDPFQNLVNQFLTSLEAEIDELEQSINQQKWEKSLKMVHNLKGRGGSFGFPEITTLATELEELLKNEQNEAIKGKFIVLKDYCVTLLSDNPIK